MRHKRILAAVLSSALLAVSLAGCGEEPETLRRDDVELLEPTGVGEACEAAARRNLYDARVYGGTVCPYTEEYSLGRTMQFDSYVALPGDHVKKGQVLTRSNTEELSERIEKQEKQLAENEKNHQEYLKEMNETLEKYKADEKFWGQAVENWAKEELTTDAEDYARWSAYYDRMYRNALIGRQKTEEAIKQKAELYEMDQEYNRLLLSRLRRERNESTVLSGMNGVVMNIQFLDQDAWMFADYPMVAVADPDRKCVKSDYISKNEINTAERLYALIDGREYELEYEPMETEEYNRLAEKNGKVYTTFYLPEEAADTELGKYVAIVLVRESRENVMTVPQEALMKGEDGSYVYLMEGEEKIYTPVRVGMQDGLYSEILSGLEEGDKVMVSTEAKAADKTAKLASGTVSYEFSGSGFLAYPVQEWICNPVEHGTTYLVESRINPYKQVKKGDVLAVIRVKPDEVELARQERSLQRERERLAKLHKEYENDKNNKDYLKSVEAWEKTITDLEKLISEMKADYARTEIVAPYDGIITDMSWELWQLKEGDLLQNGKQLFVLAEQDTNVIYVEDPNSLLTYGHKAAVTYSSVGGGRKTVEGEVVSLNRASIGQELAGETSYALIKVPAEAIGDMVGSVYSSDNWWSRSQCDITVTTRSMANVVLVPKRAVTLKAGSTYVRVKQEDGSVLYQSFIAGGSDNENYWVAEGLTEGMEVCLE